MESKLRGILFCHGQGRPDQPYKPISQLDIPQNVKWTMVDIQEVNRPDIVGDFHNDQTLYQLGLNSYDYVIEVHCPIHYSISAIVEFLHSAYKLLKLGGLCIIGSLMKTIIKDEIKLSSLDKDLEHSEINEFLLGHRPQYQKVLDQIMIESGFHISSIDKNGTIVCVKI